MFVFYSLILEVKYNFRNKIIIICHGINKKNTLALKTFVARSTAARPMPLTPTFIKIMSSSLRLTFLSNATSAVI